VHLEHIRGGQQKFLGNMADEVKGRQLETCFGAQDCPHRAVAALSLVRELKELLVEKNLREFLKTRIKGPLKIYFI
jgi:anaerobic sulfite reductase subunit C